MVHQEFVVAMGFSVVCTLFVLSLTVTGTSAQRDPNCPPAANTGELSSVPIIKDYSSVNARYLPETQPIGSIIGTIDACDPDGTPVSYYILGNGGEYFAINRETGVVTLKKLLDFETEFEIKLTIRVVDQDGQVAEKDGKIFVNDENDNAPRFKEDAISKFLSENTAVGTTVTPIEVTDVDTKNAVITVVCRPDTDLFRDACDTFELRRRQSTNIYWRGDIVLKRALDYETRTAYAIRLAANDGVHEVLNEVHIELTDINDTPPRFIQVNPKSIPEEQPVGTSIQQVTATDPDTNPRKIRYELIGNYTDVFTIDPDTGVIKVQQQLDYDLGPHQKGLPYDLTVKAREVINATTVGDTTSTTAVMNIQITVYDINDNTPTFQEKNYTAYVYENIATNANVPNLQMTITDIDSGTFNSFDLVSLDYNTTFGIIPNSDASSSSATLYVKNGENIDYEKGPRMYVIRVEARENRVTPARTGSAIVTIYVLDVNDQTPEFKEPSYFRVISELTQPETIVVKIEATDSEAGNFGTQGIRYELFGNVNDHFKIDPVTGVLRVAACSGTVGTYPCIDYEKKRVYDLTVSATDDLGGPNGRGRSISVRINITDENDNVPQVQTNYTRYINEGETVTISPLIIRAIDPDTVGGPLVYQLIGNYEKWQIDVRTDSSNMAYGNITAVQPILYEDAQNGEFNFQVQVGDGKYSTLAPVRIFVIDLNNNAPMFVRQPPSGYVEQINETTGGNVFVIRVTATDADAPTTGNGVIDFYIVNGGAGKFTVFNATREGSYYVADIYTSSQAVFNYEVQRSYNMTLMAQDRGIPTTKSGTATLRVDILDINNKNPVVKPNSQQVNVLENEPVGRMVYKLIAFDPDVDSRLEYYFEPVSGADGVGNNVPDRSVYANMFRLDKDTGELIVNGPLDRDTISRIHYNVTVKDVSAPNEQIGRGFLVVYIMEFNDQAPQFSKPLYTEDIEEEKNLNSFIMTLVCTDPDDIISSYSTTQLIPRSPVLVSLFPNSGTLIVSNRIDYEQIERIELLATCTDSGNPSLSNTTRIVINVININDNTPTFEQLLYRTTVQEGTTGGILNVSIKATDLDKGDFGVVRYRLEDNNGFFSIDPITGVITILPNATFDREVAGTYNFQVIAYDSPLNATVRRQNSVPVYITIGDINDNCPMFSKPLYTGQVPESAASNTDIIDIIANDLDEGDNARLVFNLKPGSGNPPQAEILFRVDEVTGRVQVAGDLRNRSGIYEFNLTATDMLGRNPALQCTTEVPVRVEVQESLNKAPVWIRPPQRDYVINVLESQYEGMLVYSAKAVDDNRGPSGVVDYYFYVYDEVAKENRLQSNTPEFNINRVTGVIRAEVVFDRETRDSYFLTLMAKDRGNPSASSETTLTVIILDVDDNDPEFELDPVDGTVKKLILPESGDLYENQIPPNNGYLGQCHATDLDSDDENNRIYYDLLAAKEEVREYIYVNRTSCEIYLRKPVDYETMPVLNFDIYAYNEKNDDTVKRNKREINRSILPVEVRVTDTNDNPPRFLQSQYLACVSIDAPYRQTIVEVSATDPDKGDNNKITYSINDVYKAFEIDPRLGSIYNIISFRYSSNDGRTYKLPVTASDGLNSSMASATIFVTSPSNIVRLKVNRPLTDVEPFKQQLIDTIIETSNGEIKFACINDLRNHVDADGLTSELATDVLVTAVREKSPGNYEVISAADLVGIINANKAVQGSPYNAIYVTSVKEEGDDEGFILKEDAVIAILIISILLIFLALVLFCVACYCIRDKKRKKTRKLQAKRHIYVEEVREQPVQASLNPVFHVGPDEEEYSTVKKIKPSSGPITPVVIPAPENLEPLESDDPPRDLQPVEPPRRYSFDEPEPVIETEVMPDPTPAYQHSPPRTFEPEYEDRIETEVIDNDEPSVSVQIDQPPPAVDPTMPEPPEDNEIEVEIRDSPNVSPPPSPKFADSPRYSPAASPSPPASPRNDYSPAPSPPASPRNDSSPVPSPPASPRSDDVPSPPASPRSDKRDSD